MPNIYNSIQGNIGFGKAIEYFTSQNITVSIPLNDTQKYDLVADFNGKLQRISVKTCRYSKNGISYEVSLKNCGGATGKSIIRKFDNTDCDYVFIYTANEDLYLIPANQIQALNAIVVGNRYAEFKVKIKTLSEYDKEVRMAS